MRSANRGNANNTWNVNTTGNVNNNNDTITNCGVKSMSLLKRKTANLALLADVEKALADADQNAINVEDVTVALVELGDMLAAQDDALVELAEIIAE